MSHWKKHIVFFQTRDAAVQSGWDSLGFAWRTAAMGCLAGMYRGDAGTPSLGSGCSPRGSQGMQSWMGEAFDPL